MSHLKLDLHQIFNDQHAIEEALTKLMQEAIKKRVRSVEVVPGKGSGQLKKHVLRFLEKGYKQVYQRIEKDDKNFGRIFVHFRWS